MISIKSLYIYQFGGLKQWEIRDLSSGLNVFYGENEAGKTTIMQFIAAMLFGFPHKQNGSSRYEPKDGGRRGGKIVFQDTEMGEITIQRVDGVKASGEVTVTLENGETHDEEFLKKWLESVDRAFFHGIFCFGLDGLQQLETLSESELGDFLLGAGLTGGENLTALESRLEKKTSLLFKPGGRKPLINSKLTELKDAEETLLKWKKKNESYSRLAAEKEGTASEKEKLEKRISEAERELVKLEKWKELAPILQKWSENRLYINKAGSMIFPEDGVRRYEAWRAQAVSLQGELHYLESKIDSIRKEMEKAEQLSFPIQRDELTLLNEQYQRITLMMEDAAALKASLQESGRKVRELEKEAGEEWTKDSVQSFSLTLSAKNSWQQLFNGLQQLQQRKELLNEQLVRSRKRLEEAEAEERSLHHQLLPDEERAKRLEQRTALFNEQNGTELADEYEYVRRQLQHEKKTGISGHLWGTAALVLGLIMAIAGLASIDALLYMSAVAFLAGAVLLFLYWKKMQYVKFLSSEEERLRQFKKAPSSVKRGDWLQKLEADEQLRQQWHVASRAVKEEEKTYNETAHHLDQAEVKELKLYRDAADWRQQHSWHASESMMFTAGILDVLGKLKDQYEEEDMMKSRLAKMEKHITSFENRVYQCAEASGITGSQMAYMLKEMNDRLDEKEKSLERLREMKKQDAALIERAKEIRSMLDSVEAEMTTLREAANSSDENAFYAAAKDYEMHTKRKQAFIEAELHLSSLGYGEDQLEEIAKTVVEEGETLNEKAASTAALLAEWKKKREHLAKECSQLDYEMKTLLEDGTYSSAVHHYEQLKSELQTLAKQWAVTRLAASALQKTREKYRTEKLPAVLKEASHLFCTAVAGRYDRIHLDQNGNLFVQDRQHTRFYPSELSKGTAELLYLCIRAALALHANSKEMLMIMDDITVNFDKGRTVQALRMIEDIAKQRQVLYFTCHEHVHSLLHHHKVYDMKARTTV